jgi:hypothetical protein
MNCAICGTEVEARGLHEHGFYFGPVGGRKKKEGEGKAGSAKRKGSAVKVQLQTAGICDRCLNRRRAVDAAISAAGLLLVAAAIAVPVVWGSVRPQWLTIVWMAAVASLPALTFLMLARLPGLFRPDVRGDRMLIGRLSPGLKARGYDRFYTRREVERQQERAEKRQQP